MRDLIAKLDPPSKVNVFLHNVFLSKLSYCELQNGCFQFELSSEVLNVCFTAHARRVLDRSLSSAPVVLELHLSFLVSAPNPNPTSCHPVPASVLRFSVTRVLETACTQHPNPLRVSWRFSRCITTALRKPNTLFFTYSHGSPKP